MELNVIDLSGDREERQERVRARKASGENIRMWSEVTVNTGSGTGAGTHAGQRDVPSARRRVSVSPPNMPSGRRPVTAPGRGPVSGVRPAPQRGQMSGRRPAPAPQRNSAARRSRPVRAAEPDPYERPASRRSRAAQVRARQERLRRKRIRRRKQMAARFTVLICLVGVIGLSFFFLVRLFTGREEPQRAVNAFREMPKTGGTSKEDENTGKPFITEDFLTVNEYSRPGEALEAVNNIFVHYTANRGTSAAQNRSYFENLATTGETSASAHFIIGYDGEIIQCVPLDEIAYAVMGRNYDSISIECCYLQEDGSFTDRTYQSLIRLCGWLLKEYGLTPQDMRRHYDEGGKKCPLYFTEHVEEWERFKQDLDKYMAEQDSV